MKTLTTSLILFCTPFILLAHGGKEHSETKSNTKQIEINVKNKKLIYKNINITYLKNIKPIFEKKCFDCHGTIKKHPWYYVIPGVKQMIDYDIKEAKKHLDMSRNFPFISHESPFQDLKSLKEVAIENSMPPFRYLLGHWDAELTTHEKEALIQWSNESIDKLK